MYFRILVHSGVLKSKLMECLQLDESTFLIRAKDNKLLKFLPTRV